MISTSEGISDFWTPHNCDVLARSSSARVSPVPEFDLLPGGPTDQGDFFHNSSFKMIIMIKNKTKPNFLLTTFLFDLKFYWYFPATSQLSQKPELFLSEAIHVF